MHNKFTTSHVWMAIGLLALIAALPDTANAVTGYSTSFKPNSANVLYAACIDQYTGYPMPGVQIVLTNNWIANTNSHLHPYTAGHPAGYYSPSQGTSDSTGNLQVTLYTSIVGQDEYTTVHCVPPPNYTTRDNQFYFTVGYPDVYYNDHPSIWYMVGGTVAHGGTAYNHYMETTAAYGLYYTTTDYLALHPDTPGGMLADNDQGLPYGGKFDLNQDWQSPHIYHDRGTAGDMRGNDQQYSIPVSRQGDFTRLCSARGAVLAQIEYTTAGDDDTTVGDLRRHVHCHWPIIP